MVARAVVRLSLICAMVGCRAAPLSTGALALPASSAGKELPTTVIDVFVYADGTVRAKGRTASLVDPHPLRKETWLPGYRLEWAPAGERNDTGDLPLTFRPDYEYGLSEPVSMLAPIVFKPAVRFHVDRTLLLSDLKDLFAYVAGRRAPIFANLYLVVDAGGADRSIALSTVVAILSRTECDWYLGYVRDGRFHRSLFYGTNTDSEEFQINQHREELEIAIAPLGDGRCLVEFGAGDGPREASFCPQTDRSRVVETMMSAASPIETWLGLDMWLFNYYILREHDASPRYQPLRNASKPFKFEKACLNLLKNGIQALPLSSVSELDEYFATPRGPSDDSTPRLTNFEMLGQAIENMAHSTRHPDRREFAVRIVILPHKRHIRMRLDKESSWVEEAFLASTAKPFTVQDFADVLAFLEPFWCRQVKGHWIRDVSRADRKADRRPIIDESE